MIFSRVIVDALCATMWLLAVRCGAETLATGSSAIGVMLLPECWSESCPEFCVVV